MKKYRNKILADGERLHVGLYQMDSLQRSVAKHVTRPRITDGTSDRYQLNRPGWRFRDEIVEADYDTIQARQAYEDALTSAWKGDTDTGITGYGEKGSTAGLGVQHEGDLCTINGSPGHLRKIGGKFVCVPDASDARRREPDDDDDDDSDDVDAAVAGASTHTESTVRRSVRTDQQMKDHESRMRRIYDQLDAELASAWRNGK
jgi:hypothetical protein